MMLDAKRPAGVLVVSVALSFGCNRGPAAVDQETKPVIAIPNARVYDGMLVGGQPTAEQFKDAAESGYATVINLRSVGESGYEFEAKAAEELGVSYRQISVAGADGLTRENVQAFDEALSSAGDGKIMVHCASGNRVGALFALRAAWLQDKSADEALAIGHTAGLTGLEYAVKERLSK